MARASLSQDGFQREGFWEVGRTYELESPLSSWTFLNSPGWWSLVRTSCCKITHASGCCGARPGRAVWVSGSPNSLWKGYTSPGAPLPLPDINNLWPVFLIEYTGKWLLPSTHVPIRLIYHNTTIKWALLAPPHSCVKRGTERKIARSYCIRNCI